MRRWQNGEVISVTRLKNVFREQYGSPYYVVHRANLQLSMHALALDLGVTVKVDSGVRRYNEEDGEVELEDGSLHRAQLIVAADGIHSEARKVVLGGHDQPPQEAGFAAYRALVDVESMKQDPDVSWLLEIPGQNLWYVFFSLRINPFARRYCSLKEKRWH